MKQMGLIILLALGLVACNEGSSSTDKKAAAPATEHPAKEEAKKPAEAPPAPAPTATPAPAAPTNVMKDTGKQVEQSVTAGDAAIKKAAEGEEAPKK